MIISKFKTIFSSQELSRIEVNETANALSVTVDVHNMNCRQAKRFINNIINIVHTAFQLIVIHGYNHGTAIKSMLSQNFVNPHVYRQFPDSRNQGRTHLLIYA